MVQCNCPNTHALQKRFMIGRHLDQELGSERAAVNTIWRQLLDPKATTRRSVTRNFNKVQVASFHHGPPST